MKRTTTYLIRGLLVAVAASYIQAEAKPPSAQERWINAAYVKNGVVDTGSAELAVRSGPGQNFSQIDTLSSGQRVTSDKSKDGWIRITSSSAPSSAAAVPQAAVQERWINAAYVKNGVVDTGNSSVKLAVRSGPGTGYSQIDTVSSGERVIASESRSGWMRITASGTASVSSQAPALPVTPASAPAMKRERTAKREPARTVKPEPAIPTPPVAISEEAARPVLVPVHPPVDNLILSGDFSGAALALPTTAGDTTAELSGRWLRAVASAWEISPYGGNLGPYARAAASRQTSRLLYLASDAKRSTGSYLLRFDYILTDPSDVLGVKVFVSDRDITIGTDGGDFRMNSAQRPSDMIMLPASASWTTYPLPVELGNGYNYVYVLFIGSGAGNTGIDNVSLSPRRR